MPEIASRFGLPPASVSALRAILAQHPGVEEARIYGSRAKGNYRPGSDIDLTLLGSDLTTNDLLRLEVEIEALGMPYQVDLSLFHHIEDPALRDHIARVGQIFFEARQRGQEP